MAKPNYGYQKRQRELARKKKKEEKKQSKLLNKGDSPPEKDADGPADGDRSL